MWNITMWDINILMVLIFPLVNFRKTQVHRKYQSQAKIIQKNQKIVENYTIKY